MCVLNNGNGFYEQLKYEKKISSCSTIDMNDIKSNYPAGFRDSSEFSHLPFT